MILWVYFFALLLICFHATTCVSNADDHSVGSNQRILRSIGKVEEFRLINADTNLPIVTLKNGMVVDIATLSTENLNVQAITPNETIVAIRFGYNGNSRFRTELLRPFALCGDGSPVGNYYVCKKLVVGNHTISATPYSTSGDVGETSKISFIISEVNGPTSGRCSIEKV